MSDLPSHLTRAEISSIVNNDPRAIRALEQLLRAVNTVQPAQASIDSQAIKSNKVLLWLSM